MAQVQRKLQQGIRQGPSRRRLLRQETTALVMRGRYREPLTADGLFAWHAWLFPTGRRGTKKITAGLCGETVQDPCRSSPAPSEMKYVHYEAPKADRLDAEIKESLDWFQGGRAMDSVVKAGLAHLWFVATHPFDDANRRIARAIADMALARNSP
jgi:Fic family protein